MDDGVVIGVRRLTSEICKVDDVLFSSWSSCTTSIRCAELIDWTRATTQTRFALELFSSSIRSHIAAMITKSKFKQMTSPTNRTMIEMNVDETLVVSFRIFFCFLYFSDRFFHFHLKKEHLNIACKRRSILSSKTKDKIVDHAHKKSNKTDKRTRTHSKHTRQ